MNYIFLIIINILFSPLLVASYAITEQELINIRAQAETAWPDIQDEEAFKEEIDRFQQHLCSLPYFHVNDDDSCFFILPEDPLSEIWLHQAQNEKDLIITSNQQASYTRLISKGIVIRNSWIEKKEPTKISEPQIMQFYYSLLKRLFLKKEGELFLYTVYTLIKNTKNPLNKTPTVCVLKDKLTDSPLKKQFQKHAYNMHVSHSIMASFLLHKLLETINSTHNHDHTSDIDNVQKPVQQQDTKTKKPETINNVPVKKAEQKPSLNKDNNKKDSPGYVYYAVPAAIIASVLLLLYSKNFYMKN